MSVISYKIKYGSEDSTGPVTKDYIYSHVNPEASYDDGCVFSDIKKDRYCFIDRGPEHTDEFLNYSFALYDPQKK